MSRRSDSRIARFQKHADRATTMPCGRTAWGNGGPHAHQNRCRECLTKKGAYLSESTRHGIFLNMPGADPDERLAAYAEWQRQEGDRLLAALDAEAALRDRGAPVVYAAQAVTVDGYGDPEVVVQAAETGPGQPTGDPVARVTLDGDHTDPADLDHALAGAGFRRVSEWEPCDFGSVTTVHRAQP